VMVCEIAIVLLLAVAILAYGGAHGISTVSFRPEVVLSGSPALALMFAMSGFFGFVNQPRALKRTPHWRNN
jgi:hypothetical protein